MLACLLSSHVCRIPTASFCLACTARPPGCLPCLLHIRPRDLTVGNVPYCTVSGPAPPYRFPLSSLTTLLSLSFYVVFLAPQTNNPKSQLPLNPNPGNKPVKRTCNPGRGLHLKADAGCCSSFLPRLSARPLLRVGLCSSIASSAQPAEATVSGFGLLQSLQSSSIASPPGPCLCCFRSSSLTDVPTAPAPRLPWRSFSLWLWLACSLAFLCLRLDSLVPFRACAPCSCWMLLAHAACPCWLLLVLVAAFPAGRFLILSSALLPHAPPPPPSPSDPKGCGL